MRSVVLWASCAMAALGGAEPARFDPEAAERAYRAGQYERALALYEEALGDPDIAEGAALYNMGNCVFRLGRYPEAVLHYERARLRRPRDAEVLFNLRLARRQLEIAPRPESFARTVAGLLDALRARELLAVAAVLETAGLAGFVLLRGRRTARAFTALLVLLALGLAGHLVHRLWIAAPRGIVLEGGLEVRAGPEADRPVVSELEAGVPVRVRDRVEGWLRVEHPSGSGWTRAMGVGLVE